MNTLPTKWYIEVTAENQKELSRWRKKVATQYRDHNLIAGRNTLLSEHPDDGSYYYSNTAQELRNDEGYNDYQEITLEQFRQITNPKTMNTLPQNWLIEVTEENQAELDRWRLKVATSHREGPLKVGYTLLSSHHHDGSHYYSTTPSALRSAEPYYNDYQEITLEQFRQITNPNLMNKLPQNWLIEVTEGNREELNRWRQQVATSHRDHPFKAGYTLLSRHHSDGSYFYCGDASEVRSKEHYADYQEITLEQFRQITNQNQKPMTKSIQISRELLNEYYDAATTPQREYLAEHFKLDGTTTSEAIRGLRDLACETWKPRIKKNHPECFEDEKYFDFSAMSDKHIVAPKVAQALGLSEDFIEVRHGSNPKLRNRSFYLSTNYEWELVNDGGGVVVLVPTKK
jgi:hypothetical protein